MTQVASFPWKNHLVRGEAEPECAQLRCTCKRKVDQFSKQQKFVKVKTDLRPPACVDLSADVGDLGEVPGGGRLADHLGAAALALHGGGRDPELVLGAGPELRHAEAGPAARHLVAGVTLLPAILHLPAVTANQIAYIESVTNHSRPSFLCVMCPCIET